MKWFRTRAVLFAAAGALALGAVACTPKTDVTVAAPSEQTGISVTGQGSVSVRPDIAQLNLGVEATAPTVADARTQANTAMDAIRQALASNGVEDKDIKTQFFNIYPQYVYKEAESPTITGFTVSNQLLITVRNIDATSTILDAAISAGGDAVRVSGVTFTVENPEEFLTEARQEAMANAKASAQVLADAAGVTLGNARTISESTSTPTPGPVFERAAASGGATPISPGEQELQVFVSVTFDISQ